MIVAVLAAVASMATGQTCAAIDNGADVAAWAVPKRVAVSTTYKDRGGEHLIYRRLPSGAALTALYRAEAKLTVGDAGRKVRVACSGGRR